MLSLMLLVTGCNGSGTPTKADHSGSAARNAQGEGTTSAARPASDAPGSGPQTIPGMNAGAVAAIFQAGTGMLRSGRWGRAVRLQQRGQPRHIPAVRWQDNGQRRRPGEYGLGPGCQRRGLRRLRPGFATLLRPAQRPAEYREADKKRAYEFVSRNLNSTRANTTIGAAEWTIATSRDSKTLLVTPEK